MKIPFGFERWNPAMRGAYRKGYETGEAGSPIASCPYADKRNKNGKLTWSRAFKAAWRDGWIAGDESRKSALITSYCASKSQTGQPPGLPR